MMQASDFSTHPSAVGFFMPAEWHPHQATWMVWPKNRDTWRDRVSQVQAIYLNIFELLSPHETVHLLVDDEEAAESVRPQLEERKAPTERISFHLIPTVDAWIRDYGPNFLIREKAGKLELALNHWRFNAWGEKYEDLRQDECVTAQIGSILNVPSFSPKLVLEGGSIDVNGRGDCLTTEQCLLNQNRNPDHSVEEIEAFLKAYLGVREVTWLAGGIEGDDTDGHVDDIARFVNPSTIVCALEADPSANNYPILRENFQRLLSTHDSFGKPFQIVPLLMPEPVIGAGQRLPASYLNFYIANRLVLVPTFDQANDQKAIDTLQSVCLDRRVVGVQCEALTWGLGAIHCLTQQQPAVYV